MPSYPNVPSGLPDSVTAWRDMDVFRDPLWSKPWELLRPLFKEAGYELYDPQPGRRSSTPRSQNPPSLDSFGLHGDRSDFASRFRCISNVFAARDRENRDVVIKLVSKGDENCVEREILQLLSSEPMRSDPANPTVQVLEFIELGDYCFAVFPCYDECDARPFLGSSECLEFAEQVLEGLSYLHEHRIAHLDISQENIVINHHGKLPPTYENEGNEDANSLPIRIFPPLQWRSTFPVRYFFIDFGCSVYFEEGTKLSAATVKPFPVGREHRAPETTRSRPYNPFAADVYQVARLFYAWLKDIADSQPALLRLLQDMSSYNPSRRISAVTALARLRAIRRNILDDEQERRMLWFPLIPRSHLVMFRDILECRQWSLAFQFLWKISTIWFTLLLTSLRISFIDFVRRKKENP